MFVFPRALGGPAGKIGGSLGKQGVKQAATAGLKAGATQGAKQGAKKGFTQGAKNALQKGAKGAENMNEKYNSVQEKIATVQGAYAQTTATAAAAVGPPPPAYASDAPSGYDAAGAPPVYDQGGYLQGWEEDVDDDDE